MKHFVTYVISAKPDGSFQPLQENISTEEQKTMMAFFKSRAEVYTDKAQIILRIYPQIMKNIFHQYKELWLSKEDVRFNALLITRFYEHTTRLDRGDGITMIRLSRDIIDYGKR